MSGYFVVDEDTREVVGSCAFKGPPAADGIVEIAYFTYLGSRRGYATAMATKQIRAGERLAGGAAGDRPTLPEPNASSGGCQGRDDLCRRGD